MDVPRNRRAIHRHSPGSTPWIAIGVLTLIVLTIVVGIGLEGQMVGTVAGVITGALVLVSVTVGLIYVYVVIQHISGPSGR